jgi:hypothetical protein
MKNVGPHEPIQMLEVESFDEVFLLTVEDILVYECPYCKRQVTDFAKNFFFQEDLSICTGMIEVIPDEELYSTDDTPF